MRQEQDDQAATMVAAPVAVSTSPQMASVPSAEATAAWAPETKNCGKPGRSASGPTR